MDRNGNSKLTMLKPGKISADVGEFYSRLKKRALANNGGDPDFQNWKSHTLEKIIQLATQAPRLRLHDAQLDGDLHLFYQIRQPVPRFPVNDQLVVDHQAIYHLHYTEDWLTEAPHGWEPLGLVYPHDPWHPNCRPALRGAICLGELPPGILPEEILLLGYQTMSLQMCTLDETDPHGVLNMVACDYYRRHPEYLPLTPVGLMEPWEPEGGK